MRGSDVVDLVLELAPRWFMRGVILLLVAWMALSGNTGLITWYADDKAQALVDMVLVPLIDDLTPPVLASDSPLEVTS